MGQYWLGRAYAYTIGVPIEKDSSGKWVTSYADFTSYFLALIKLAINIAGSLAILVILWGAFRYVTSAGDEAKAKEAKDLIIGAVVGFALLVLIRVLVPIIGIQ